MQQQIAGGNRGYPQQQPYGYYPTAPYNQQGAAYPPQQYNGGFPQQYGGLPPQQYGVPQTQQYPGPPVQGYGQYGDNNYNAYGGDVHDTTAIPVQAQRDASVWNDWNVDASKLLSEDMDVRIRMGFVRKVYGILAGQLAITFGLATFFNAYSPAAAWLYHNPWVLIVVMISSFASICAMACVPKAAKTSPTNYILLGLISFSMGILLGYSTGAVNTSAFAIAAGMTLAVTVAVSLFACQTKWDFTGFGVYGLAFFVVLMIFGITAAFIQNMVVQIVYASLGALLFSFYLIMDTQRIVGGKHRKYPFTIDDYAFAALALYMDILNLFMYILQIVAMVDNN